jgi:hypothetical protein
MREIFTLEIFLDKLIFIMLYISYDEPYANNGFERYWYS